MKGSTIGMLAVVCALSAGCSKKAEEPKPVKEVAAPEASMVDSAKEQALEQVESMKKQMDAVQKQAAQQIADAEKLAESKVAEYKEILVSATRPISEIKAEAEKLDIEQLKQAALKYKEAITAKGAELEPLLQKFKDLPMSQKLSGEALGIKDDIAQVTDSLNALKERYEIYASKLKEMGVDLSSYMK